MTAGRSAAAGTAGRSAADAARRYRRLAAECQQLAIAYEAGASGERRIGALLEPLSAAGWVVLADRRWPGSRRANVDFVLVGPGGLVLLDAKNWSGLRVQGEVLLRGDERCDEDLHAMARLAGQAEVALTGTGLAPTEIHPVLAFVGERLDVRVGRVRLLGEADLLGWLASLGRRLDEDQVRGLVAAVTESFAPMTGASPARPQVPFRPARRQPARRQPVGQQEQPVGQQEQQEQLFDLAAIEEAALAGALRGSIEDWMVFLHPSQVEVVRRRFSGPARLSGAAGSGKTVVGLHRAAHLARRGDGRVLFATYVRTLPVVMSALFRRLAPHDTDRVDFVGVHRWASELLEAQGVRRRPIDTTAVEDAFARAWLRTGRGSRLESLDVGIGYWQQEIDRVVKGRGLDSFEDYAALERVGRRTPLPADVRALVWDLYCDYQERLDRARVWDFNDLLLAAVQVVESDAFDSPYRHVVLDEVQDLTLNAVRLMYGLVGDAPDGLLLIGDGQQQVYPGGWRLAEARISVAGRSPRFRTNYRNGAEILAAARAALAEDAFDDIDGVVSPTPEDYRVARPGGRVGTVRAATRREHDVAMLCALEQLLRQGVRAGDVAVLAASTATAQDYLGLLRQAGIAAVALADYDGRPRDAVKVGTIKRAKGLEFAAVFLPVLSEGPPAQRPGEADSAHRERVEQHQRELFVGMTRARDALWRGYVTPALRTGAADRTDW